MSPLQELVSSYIQTKRGWAVAGQFEATFDDEAFEEQNYNALIYIREDVTHLLRSGVFNQDSQNILQVYVEELHQYLDWQNA
jgi:hypothetical protein